MGAASTGPAGEARAGEEAAETKEPGAAGGAYGPVRRKEDARFIRGQGTFTDDIQLPGMLHGAILRSPLAHARIVSIDTAARRPIPGSRP